MSNKKQFTWKDYPKLSDKLAIVGFHDATRDKAPYEDESYEIWGVNEEYSYPWLKRFDKIFQVHPRWDFSRSNNMNDPNHFSWLKDIKGKCLSCNGSGRLGRDASEIKCPHCEDGVYDPQKNRRGEVPIFMQHSHADIPYSVAIPLTEIVHNFQPGSKPYFTSSCSYQMGMAMLMGYKKIEFYGYDMGTTTEYHYQRANFEYWIGLAHGAGFDVTLPGSGILTGELYGYDNMKTGYRQQLEMREYNLDQQFAKVKTNCTRLEARLAELGELRKIYPDLEDRYKETRLKLAKQEGILNFINGAKTETDNLTKLYSSYFLSGNETGKETEDGSIHPGYEENIQFVNARYVDKEGDDGTA